MAMTLAERIAAKRQKTADKKAGSQTAYRFKMAKTIIRILPSWRPADHEDAELFYHEFGQTWIKDMDGKVMAVVGDAKMTFGEDDPVRNLLDVAVAQAKTDAQRKHYKDMKGKPRVLVNALVLNDPEVSKTEAQLVEFSETQFDTILKDIENAIKYKQDVLSLTDGFNIEVEKSGKGLETKYKFTLDRGPTEVPASVMATLIDIDAFVRSQFADNDRAINAIKALTQGEPLALVDRGTDLSRGRSERTTSNEVVDADYSPVDDALDGGADVDVVNVEATDDEIEALFDN